MKVKLRSYSRDAICLTPLSALDPKLRLTEFIKELGEFRYAVRDPCP